MDLRGSKRAYEARGHCTSRGGYTHALLLSFVGPRRTELPELF